MAAADSCYVREWTFACQTTQGSNKDEKFFKTPVPEVPGPVTDWKVVE